MTKVIKRNLPLNETYIIVDSYYSSIIDNGGSVCSNCNKVISNIAVIKNTLGEQFQVGLDCAETLSNLNGLLSVQMEFAESKGIRAKINKAKKENKTVQSEITPNGEIVIRINDCSVQWIGQSFAQKYLPEVIKMLSNGDKLGFIKSEFTTIQFNGLKGLELRNYLYNLLETPKQFNILGFNIVCSLVDGVKMDGTPNGSKLFHWDIYRGLDLLKAGSTYNVSDINSRIEWSVNEILLNQ